MAKLLLIRKKTVSLHLIDNKNRKCYMPEICRFYGIIISMFGDDHNPPHFHVRYGDYRCTVTIDKGVVKGELPRKALKKVFDWMDEHHDELMSNWARLQSGEKALPITPLK